jgi:chromate reductase
MSVRLVAFSGSLRSESYNRRLLGVAAGEASAAGAHVEVLRLGELELPLFDEDLERERGLPAGAIRLKRLLAEADGMLVASPEYNGFPTAALKNAVDWASRKASPEEPPLEAFRGKVAGIMAASPGALGGIRGLPHLRSLLAGLGVIVLPEQHALGNADRKFTDDGRLIDERDAAAVARSARRTVEVAAALSQA